MKVLKAEVNWYEGWANDPVLVIHVDNWPRGDEFKYQVLNRQGSDLYWAHHPDGAVSFHCHNRSNQNGYGGAIFELNMLDGSSKKIRGPWSSRSGVMNNYFPHSTEVQIKEESTGYNLSGHISIELAERVANMAGVKLVKEYRRGDIIYSVEPLLSGDELIQQHCGFNPESEES
jgi:hypothetical protein